MAEKVTHHDVENRSDELVEVPYEGLALGVSADQNAALVRKQDWRIVPLAAAIYLLCYLDRSNIGTDTSSCCYYFH